MFYRLAHINAKDREALLRFGIFNTISQRQSLNLWLSVYQHLWLQYSPSNTSRVDYHSYRCFINTCLFWAQHKSLTGTCINRKLIVPETLPHFDMFPTPDAPNIWSTPLQNSSPNQCKQHVIFIPFDHWAILSEPPEVLQPGVRGAEAILWCNDKLRFFYPLLSPFTVKDWSFKKE